MRDVLELVFSVTVEESAGGLFEAADYRII